MTALLFRDDAYATAFNAQVLEVDGGRVRLDRTLFYPEGGGQPADTGELTCAGGNARVTDVQKVGGVVWHVLEGATPAVGDDVRGELDWRARYRHMQRHSAEHLLAQAFLRVRSDIRVQSVSMRSAFCTLDFEGNPTDADARAAESVLRDVIARDLPIEAFEVPEAGLAAYPLRRAPQVRGTVRLVGVRDGDGWWEMVACGGTHLRSTAFVAPVVVLGLERVKGGLTRVTFMAGEEATEYLGSVYRAARQLAQAQSVPVDRLVGRTQTTLDEVARLRGELERTQAELARALVQAAGARAFHQGELRFVRVPGAALVMPALKALVDLPATVGVVVAADGRVGVTSSVADVHAGQQLNAWLQAAGGRGGGKPDVAQGQATDVAAFERAALHSAN